MMDDLKGYLVRGDPDGLGEYLVSREPEAEKSQGSSFFGGIGRSLATGAGSALGGITSALGYVGKKAGTMNPVEPERVFKGTGIAPQGKVDLGDDLSEFLLKVGGDSADAAQSWSKDVPQDLVNKTAAGVGSMIPYLAAGAVTGGMSGVPILGQVLRSEVETQSNAAQTYEELRKAGYDDAAAMAAAARQEWPDRVVNAALEPFGALSNKGRLVRMAAEAVSEGALQEPLQGITQSAAVRSAGGSLGDFGSALVDEVKRYPEYFKDAGVPAMIAGGLVGGLSPGVGRVQEKSQEQAQPSRVAGAAPEGLREFLVSDSDFGVRPQVGDVFVDANGVRHTVTKFGKDGLALESATGKKSGMRYADFESRGFRKLSPDEVSAGIGIQSLEGVFGPAYQEYEGKPIAAAAKLLHEKTGEVKNAFRDSDGEPIDFVYGKAGDNGYGIAHIVEKHGKKILVRLPNIVLYGQKSISPENTVVYRLGNEVVTVKQQWDGQYKRWVVTAYKKDGNPSFKNNVPFSYGRSTDVDQFSPRDDSPSGLNGIIDERLSDNSDNVNELNSIQRFAHEPVMPRGSEVSDVKVGDVKRLISEALDVPVREGQIRKKGLGGFISYNPYIGGKNDIVRMKATNDIASLLHEFGHGIDHIYGLTESNMARKQVWPEFAKFGKSMGYTADKWLSEGLAQFYQWRGIDPKQAYQMFPEYSKIFDEFMTANPEARGKIEPVFKAAHDYYFGSPETRLDAVIGKGKEPRRGLKQWAADTLKSARREVFDRQQVFSDVGDMVSEAIDNPEVMAQLGINADKVKKFGLKRMLPDSINLEAQARTMPGTQAVVNDQVDGFLSSIKGMSADEYRALKLYLVAGGGLDYYRNGMNPGLGLSPGELLKIRNSTPEHVRTAAAELREKYNLMMEKTLVKTGMLSQKKLKEWRVQYPDYVPMLHEDGSGGFSVLSPKQALERGFVDLADPIGKRKGVKDESSLVSRRDPVVSMVENFKRFNDFKARNDVARTLINISKLPGLMRVAEKVSGPGANTFTVWEKGHRRYYATDPEIYEALKSLGESGISDKSILKFAHNVGDLFKMGTTRYNPWFILKNLVRDSFTASVQSGSDVTDLSNLPIVNTFDGVLKMLNNKRTYKSAKANGVFYSSMVELSRENIPKLIEQQLSGGRLKESLRTVRGALDKLGAMNETVELAPKMREYSKLRKMGIPEKQAAMEAREVNTDFQRGSNLGRELNKYVPFLNAQLQGLDKAVRTFAARPVESAMKAGVYLTLPSVLEWILYHDDEDYKGLDKGIKDTHWVFRLPGAAPDDFVRVPMPFETGVLFGGAPKRALDKLFMDDPAAFYGFVDSVQEALLPDLQVALLRPMMEVWANKDSFRDRPIVPLREQNLPTRLQYGGSTSYPAKLAGNFGVSPRVADHLIRGYGGTMAGQAAHLFDVFDNGKAPAAARNWHESALARPYTISSNTSNHYLNRFYDVADELEREMQGAKQEGSAFLDRGLASMMNGRRSALSRIWKRIGQVKDARGMSPEAKKAEIDRLNEQAVKIARMSLEVYDRRREKR